MKFYTFFFIVLVTVFPLTLRADETNAGFVKGLWYSEEPVFAGIPTRIYIALRNNTDHDLTGTVRFSDNGIRIGSSEVSALSGRLVEAWVDWTPTQGVHVISAKVTDATLHKLGGGTESIDITDIVAEDTLTVEYDTDSDGVGNTQDADDDNDTVSDTDEIARGSDPLVTNPQPIENARADTTHTVDTLSKAPSTLVTHAETGLEQFLDEGGVDSFLTHTTQKIEQAKITLDAYRAKRSEALTQREDDGNTNFTEDTENVPSTETTLGTHRDTATITRSRIPEKESFLASFVSHTAKFLSTLWTYILLIISKILSFPAVLEATLLLVILASLYRIARRLGRRNRY